LRSEQSHQDATTSSPTPEKLAAWRVFLETAYALIDILDAELQAERGISLGWYDALVHLEEAEDGLRMNELASRILLSKSGLTRAVDRMEAAGLVRRERRADNRRVVLVHITPVGLETLQAARSVHRRGIQEHFVRHLDPQRLATLPQALERVHDHVRPLRPGRVSG
jgi:DNA-binding MarR family transcriptional regulator